MTIRKTDDHIWDKEKFIITDWDEKQMMQIESVRRTLCLLKRTDEVTVQEAVNEMIDFAYTKLLVDRINEEYE